MPQAMNFHQEWGCLAPAPSFLRTMRTVLVATAVGATAGGGVVLSLVGHSAGQTSVAERTLVRPILAVSTSVSAPQTAQLNSRPLNQRESTEALGAFLAEIVVEFARGRDVCAPMGRCEGSRKSYVDRNIGLTQRALWRSKHQRARE
jgi:hypothetical protein